MSARADVDPRSAIPPPGTDNSSAADPSRNGLPRTAAAGPVLDAGGGPYPSSPVSGGVPPPAMQRFSDSQFFRRSILVVSLVVVASLLLALIWFASEVFLLMFAAIMLAVLLRAPTNWLVQRTPLSENFALGLSILAFGAVLGTLVYLFAVPLMDQVTQLVDTLPAAMAHLRKWMWHYSWAKPLQPLVAELARLKVDTQMLGRASGFISYTFEGLAGFVVMLFIGVYLAAQPRLYQRGFMHLLPHKARSRANDVLDEIGSVLRWWLFGRVMTMTVVGVAAGIGLWWLDVPLAFTLGVMSGLLEFIPYLGPILSAVPALLVAFNVGPTEAFYVLMLYVVIQSAENYLLSPLIEQRTVSLPPALVLFSTLLLAALSGPLGVILASPLTATCIVAVKLLYVEDVVEQPPKK
jgi:predicted PurR-regulated permease PerM